MFSEQDYKDAIEKLTLGMGQLEPDGNLCSVCGDSGHQAWECYHNPLVLLQHIQRTKTKWRCYHCGEVFEDAEEARKHFGNTSDATPRCTLRKCLCLDCSCNPMECSGKITVS